MSMVMALRVTFAEGRAYFGNTQQTEVAQTSERLSTWLCEHRQRLLGEDPALNAVRLRVVRVAASLVGQ